jgi:PHD/YefM family antitoxin component YafN of YafNO toxin-antitoxin module
MDRVLKTISLSDFRNHQLETLAAIQDAPVVLTQNGRSAALLVLPNQWNELLEQIADLEDSVAALEMELAIERKEVAVQTITDPQQFRREMLQHEAVPA